MGKFMLSLHDDMLKRLQGEATERGITVQELLRAVVIPEYFKTLPKPTVRPLWEK